MNTANEVLKKIINKNYHINCLARDAYRGFIKAYDSFEQNEVDDLDQIKLAVSYGLNSPPKTNLDEPATKGS